MSYHRTSELMDDAGGTMPVELVCLKTDRTWDKFTVHIPAETPPDRVEEVAVAKADEVHGEALWLLYKHRTISLDAEYAPNEP